MSENYYEIWFRGSLIIEAETLDIALREAFDTSGDNDYQQVFIWKDGECIAAVTKSER